MNCPSYYRIIHDSELGHDLTLFSGNYGVVTSIVIKAHPPMRYFWVNLNFATATTNINRFWEGVKIAYAFPPTWVDRGGHISTYLSAGANDSYTFTAAHSIAGLSASEVTAIIRPLFADLGAAGINVTAPVLRDADARGTSGTLISRSPSHVLSNTRYHSRLIPRANFVSGPALYGSTLAAFRASVEEGKYLFHTHSYAPTRAVAGAPGNDSALNPAWRETVCHAMVMEDVPARLTAAEARAADARVRPYTDRIRALTPGAGAYMNEGDPAEPGWQQAFYGANYARLAGIKGRVDPWGVFWAQTTPGGEGWAVRTEYPASQNGRLCRVGED